MCAFHKVPYWYTCKTVEIGLVVSPTTVPYVTQLYIQNFPKKLLEQGYDIKKF